MLCRAGGDFKQVEATVFIITTEVSEIAEQGIAGFLSPKPIEHRVGQDSLEQHGEFRDGLVSVAVTQLDHAVLEDVQCRILIPNVVVGTFERLFFHVFQKF